MPTILIVDDSRFQHVFIRNALASEGYSLLFASNGKEALAALDDSRVDCVVADLIMPEMRGVTLLETLQKREADVPVVILTADIQDHVRKQCLDLGAREVLHKPVAEEDLRRTLAEVLAGPPR